MYDNFNEKERLKEKIWRHFGWIVPILLLIFTFGFTYVSIAKSNKDIEIEINNPYNVKISLEFKCDWKKDAFSYYKKLHISKKGKVVLFVPKKLRKCQIWPKASVW